MSRKYLPTLSELIDRLSIAQLKEVFIPEHKKEYAKEIKALYDMGDKERKRIGKIGRNWVLGDEAGFTAEKQANRVIEGMDELFQKFKSKPKFTFTKDTNIDRKVLNHKLKY